MQKVTAAAKKRFTSRFTSGINILMPCLNFIRLLQVVFSSQQRLNRPAVNAVQSVQDNNSENQVFSANEYINYEYFSSDELVALFCIKRGTVMRPVRLVFPSIGLLLFWSYCLIRHYLIALKASEKNETNKSLCTVTGAPNINCIATVLISDICRFSQLPPPLPMLPLPILSESKTTNLFVRVFNCSALEAELTVDRLRVDVPFHSMAEERFWHMHFFLQTAFAILMKMKLTPMVHPVVQTFCGLQLMNLVTLLESITHT